MDTPRGACAGKSCQSTSPDRIPSSSSREACIPLSPSGRQVRSHPHSIALRDKFLYIAAQTVLPPATKVGDTVVANVHSREKEQRPLTHKIPSSKQDPTLPAAHASPVSSCLSISAASKQNVNALSIPLRQTLLTAPPFKRHPESQISAVKRPRTGLGDKSQYITIPTGPSPILFHTPPRSSTEHLVPRLVNLGNTCFVSAAVVKTINNPVVRSLLYQCFKRGLQARSGMQSLVEPLAALLLPSASTTVSPQALCEAIWKLEDGTLYPKGSQGDSALLERHFVEAILGIVSGLSEPLPPTKLSIEEEIDFLGTASHNAFRQFDLRFSTQKKCLNNTCRRESVSFDRKLSLELPFRQSSSEIITLADLLRDISTPFTNHDFQCENCRQSEHVFTDRITATPDTILLSINRFQREDGATQFMKNNRPVSIPGKVSITALSTGANSLPSVVYAVTGVTCHIGTNLSQGHYICHNRLSDGWYIHNDSNRTGPFPNPNLDPRTVYSLTLVRQGLIPGLSVESDVSLTRQYSPTVPPVQEITAPHAAYVGMSREAVDPPLPNGEEEEDSEDICPYLLDSNEEDDESTQARNIQFPSELAFMAAVDESIKQHPLSRELNEAWKAIQAAKAPPDFVHPLALLQKDWDREVLELIGSNPSIFKNKRLGRFFPDYRTRDLCLFNWKPEEDPEGSFLQEEDKSWTVKMVRRMGGSDPSISCVDIMARAYPRKDTGKVPFDREDHIVRSFHALAMEIERKICLSLTNSTFCIFGRDTQALWSGSVVTHFAEERISASKADKAMHAERLLSIYGKYMSLLEAEEIECHTICVAVPVKDSSYRAASLLRFEKLRSQTWSQASISVECHALPGLFGQGHKSSLSIGTAFLLFQLMGKQRRQTIMPALHWLFDFGKKGALMYAGTIRRWGGVESPHLSDEEYMRQCPGAYDWMCYCLSCEKLRPYICQALGLDSSSGLDDIHAAIAAQGTHTARVISRAWSIKANHTRQLRKSGALGNVKTVRLDERNDQGRQEHASRRQKYNTLKEKRALHTLRGDEEALLIRLESYFVNKQKVTERNTSRKWEGRARRAAIHMKKAQGESLTAEEEADLLAIEVEEQKMRDFAYRNNNRIKLAIEEVRYRETQGIGQEDDQDLLQQLLVQKRVKQERTNQSVAKHARRFKSEIARISNQDLLTHEDAARLEMLEVEEKKRKRLLTDRQIARNNRFNRKIAELEATMQTTASSEDDVSKLQELRSAEAARKAKRAADMRAARKQNQVSVQAIEQQARNEGRKLTRAEQAEIEALQKKEEVRLKKKRESAAKERAAKKKRQSGQNTEPKKTKK